MPFNSIPISTHFCSYYQPKHFPIIQSGLKVHSAYACMYAGLTLVVMGPWVRLPTLYAPLYKVINIHFDLRNVKFVLSM